MTYGTGCFAMLNLATTLKFRPGFLTTVLYRHKGVSHFALEGSIEAGGAHISWLKRLGLVLSDEELDPLCSQVKDAAGVRFYPFHGGAYSPYWRNEVSGQIKGLSFHSGRREIIRALL